MLTTRERIGFGTAPLSVVLAHWAAVSAVGSTITPAAPFAAYTHILFFFLFFGVPIAYLVTGLGVLPLYEWITSKKHITGSLALVGVATAIGGITNPFFWLFVDQLARETLPTVMTLIAIGLIAGAAGGLTFIAVVPVHERGHLTSA